MLARETWIERPSPMIRTSKLVFVALLLTSIAGFAAADPPARSLAAAKAVEGRPLPSRQLDLRAPDITQIYSREQINRVLAPTYADNIEEIEVEGARAPPPPNTPNVWPAIAAPIWALLHPLQAWRIFVPMPPDRTRHAGKRTCRFHDRLSRDRPRRHTDQSNMTLSVSNARPPQTRVLSFEGGCNFRDIGGYRAQDGRMVRWGQVYRTGLLTYFTERDHEPLMTLKVRAICDLRRAEEREREPSRWPDSAADALYWHDGAVMPTIRKLAVGRPVTAAGMFDVMTDLYRALPAWMGGRIGGMFQCIAHGKVPVVDSLRGRQGSHRHRDRRAVARTRRAEGNRDRGLPADE